MFPLRGTLFNTATVTVGSIIGAVFGSWIPQAMLPTVLSGLGLITIGMGLKLFLSSKNVMILALAIALGGAMGTAIGIQAGIESFGEWAKTTLGASNQATFSEGVITASVLFCVGPMTLMGCIQESVERKIDLISLKSTLDGFAAIFLAATLGWGVLVSALVVLVVQGALTAFGAKLKFLVDDDRLIAEASGAGGPILMAIGLGLLEIKRIPSANFFPALILAPLLVLMGDKLASLKARSAT